LKACANRVKAAQRACTTRATDDASHAHGRASSSGTRSEEATRAFADKTSRIDEAPFRDPRRAVAVKRTTAAASGPTAAAPDVAASFATVRTRADVLSSIAMHHLGPRDLRVTILASGSSGNATLFEARGTRVLVDGGVAPRTLTNLLHETGAGGRPQAIVLTHAHDDHLGHAPEMARKWRIPIYATHSTARSLPFGGVEIRRFSPRDPFVLGALTFRPWPVPHDAANVALVVEEGARRVGLATDLGEITAGVADHLHDVDVLMIESNHDVDMVRRSDYPHFLQRRILSARGHLSNVQTHALLRDLSPRTHAVVLMHLSRSNNATDIALEAARDALSSREVSIEAAPTMGARCLQVAPHCTRATEQLDLFARWHVGCFEGGHASAVDASRRRLALRISRTYARAR
jgi:phosphoribosyl 1,2-cyclic phosphodiesterase